MLLAWQTLRAADSAGTGEAGPENRGDRGDDRVCKVTGRWYPDNCLPNDLSCFFREFPGFALGPDDLDDQYQELKTDLRGKLFDPDTYYGVTYNLPQSAVNRRNEIWIPAI